ncbi:MAG: HYR domain-containing protein, partial [Flavobacteriales bacterium]|nr:HYR domain-containing protein [Flavobacteriales bacterium]
TDNCGVTSLSASPTSFTCADAGANTSTLTVTDASGNASTCDATVTVSDNSDPTLIGCPSDINITANSNDCSPSVTWTEPTADDNCSATVSSNYSPGDNFPVGTTTVTYTATDPSGNSVSCSFDVTITPSQLSVSIAPSTVQCGANISCNGETDGEATANVSGGCEPYTYLWSDGQTTQTATALGAGTYSVIVTDANGTQATQTVTLTEPDALAIDGSEVSEYVGGANVSCNGASDGSIEISVVGGSTCEPYDILWTGPNGFTSTDEDIFDLEAGTYTVTITDLNGCSTTETYTLTAPDGLSPTCSSEDALCNGDANGSVEVSVSGGTAPYSYAWNNGNQNAAQTGLTAGTYVVTVTDANGCTANCNSVVAQPNPLTAVVIVQDETLVNGCNGWATANPSGGTPPYSYNWSDGQTTQTASNLCAGTYTVTITDANGCEFTTSNVINPPSCDLDVDLTGTDVNCHDGSDGTATATPITVQNNTPFTYLWNNGGTTQTISGLTAGPYSVTVTDSIGCEASGTVVITEPNALSVSTVVVDEQTFEGCDGSATANPSGGTPPYTYDWSDGQTTQTASDLCPGTYTVTVTDANGCSETVTITVNPLLCTGFTVAINTHGLSCFQAGDGSAVAVITGGSAPFTYSWSNGGTTDSIGGLAAGQYTLTVTDAVNCSQTISTNVSQPAHLEAATAVDNVTCHGVGNGVVELTVTGGTTPYVFAWSTSTGSAQANGATTEDLENVGPGSYNVSITDAHGCTTTASGTVTEPDTLSVTSVDVNPTCFEGNDGSIDVTVSGGLGPYLASWSNGDNTLDISGLSAGTYTATIVDQNGCVYTYSTTLTDPNQLTATISANGPTSFCEGDSVVLTASTAATYSWSPNGETSQSITVYGSGSYSVVITDQNGCVGESTTTQIVVFEVDTPTITATGPLEFCQGDRVTLISSVADAYLWSPTGEITQQITVGTSGVYEVTVTDGNGCSSTSDPVEVIVNPLPQVSITPSGPTEFCNGGSVTLTSSVADSYFWFPNGETTQSITVTESGNYGVAVVDANGCGNESQFVSVTVYDNPNVVITADGPITFCQGDSVTLTSSVANTYLWNPNGETTQSITVSETGTFSVIVTDANGCTGESNSISVNVLESDTASITVAGHTTFCDGDSVMLTAAQGDAYLWAPNGETTQTIAATQTGSYSVTVINESGCSEVSDTVDITVNPNPEPVVTANGPTAFCESDSVTLTTTTSGAYFWNPNGETTQSITVSETGTFSVVVTDVNGCSGESNAVDVTVFQTDSFPIFASGPTEFCEGKELALTAGAYGTYLWSPTGETTQIILATASGSYSVAVTDENGCVAYSDTVDVSVFDNPQPVITANGPLSFCQGDSVTLSTGTFDDYDWHPNGEITQAITVSEAGDYWVMVTDTNGCAGNSDTVSVEIFMPDTAVITANGPTEFCAGDQVTLTASQGSAYLWSPNGETTPSIVVTASGEYSVEVTDANGCSSTSDTMEIIVNPNPTPSITPDGPTEFCPGETVTLTASVADGYLWSPNGQTTQSITIGEDGIYTVTVVDSNGCSGTSNGVTVTVFPTPNPTISTNGPTEFCEGGSVTLTSTSASSYLWTPNGETTQSISVTESGVYSVTIVDANGCEGSVLTAVEVTVFEPDTATVTASGLTEFCEGGEVGLTASGGSSYQWAPNGETTQSITATATGTYVVTVTDANGCATSSDSVDVTVFNNPEPAISMSGATTFCEGDSVTLTAPSSLAYLWEPGGQTTQSITVFAAGSFSVQVADANTCVGTSDTVDVEVFEATPVAITADGPTSFCDGGEVNLTATGGQSYAWNPNGEQTQSISVSQSGEYVVTVVDTNGCSYDSDTTEVTVFDLPEVLVSVDGPTATCEGDTILLTATASPSNVNYQWFDNSQPMGGETDSTLDVLEASTYSVTVTDENGCTAIDNAPTVEFVPVPVAVVSEDQWMCTNDSVTLVASGGDNFVWSDGSTGASITVSPDSITVYTVTVSNDLCSETSSASTTVTLYPSPTAVIGTLPNGALEVMVPFNDASGDSSIVGWYWDFGDGEFSEEQDTEHPYGSEGFFTVTLTVSNEFGCTDMDTVEIEITQIIDVPNVFTPNHDGYNDFLYIDNFGVIQYTMTIYNRWGLVMHHDETGEVFWDGKTPAGLDAAPGTYYYTLDVINEFSEGSFKKTGTITLIR